MGLASGLGGWAGPLLALVLWILALLTGLALLGYSAADPTPGAWRAGPVANHLGQAGALVAGLGYELAGLGAWLLPLLMALAGGLAWRRRRLELLLPLWAGGLALLLALSCLLGLVGGQVGLGGARLPLGGQAGAAMAEHLRDVLGTNGAWTLGGLVFLAGLLPFAWALPWRRPALSQPAQPAPAPEQPRPRVEPLVDHPLDPTWEPLTAQPVPQASAASPAAPDPVSEPEPEPEAESTAMVSPATPATPDQGPRIKPRPAVPAPVASRRPQAASRAAQRLSLPPPELLREPTGQRPPDQEETLRYNSRLLEKKLLDFGVQGAVVEVAPGPVVTMYEFKPAPGVKISKVAGLADDLAMNLKAHSIRIVAPIPGKAVIGIEIPSPVRETVFLKEILASAAYQEAPSPLAVALGKDILGQPVADDLARMPHLLIAGATGAGKSVFINTLVLSILYKSTPDEVRLLMVDPKRIELSTYADIPHLLYPIITSPKEATAGLRWAVMEMERRYELLASAGVRNIRSFNQRLEKEGLLAPGGGGAGGEATDPEHPARLSPLPYILVIIDELADLMMVSSKEVEALITRLAQMARAAGIHLVLATQRPSVDVITGLIKANFPARISFQVSSRVDSRTILDCQGAEHLLGMGDMLFLPPGSSALQRIHGALVTDLEIERVVEFWKGQAQPQYDESIVRAGAEGEDEENAGEGEDERYADAVALVKQTGQASISGLQRRLRVGYNRAARMIEQMERDGIVGPSDGSRPREVLIRS
ncbi:MAG: DNA translocase FtsK 4TM domain-containing protein [Pseudomonadota bacterium]